MGFFADHSADGRLQKSRLYFLGFPAPLATVAGSVSSGSHTVTPSSMTGVTVGATLAVSNADGSAVETVTVTATTTSTFTATFASAHSANWIFHAPAPFYWTDYDIDIEWNGHTWLARSITPGPVNTQPTGATATFIVADGSGALFSVFAAINGGELAEAAIYEAGFLNDNLTPVPDEVLEVFSGVVDRAVFDSASTDSVEIALLQPQGPQSGFLPTRLISTLVRNTV